MRVEHTKISPKTYTAGHLEHRKPENLAGMSQQHEIAVTKRRKVAARRHTKIILGSGGNHATRPSVNKTLF